MDIDLGSMSYGDLQKLSKRVDKALAGHEKRRKKEAKQAIEKLAREYGYSVDDVLGGKVAVDGEAKPARKPRAKAVNKAKPMYRNPANADQTWTGKGRRPNWFIAAVDGGADPETLKI